MRHLRDFGDANPRFTTDMLVAQAQLLLQMEQPEEAMRVLDEALAATPDDPALHAAHAQLYVLRVQGVVDRGALDEAETLLERGPARYPDNSVAALLAGAAVRRPRSAIARRSTCSSRWPKRHPDDAADSERATAIF